jgi:hypothetical protein
MMHGQGVHITEEGGWDCKVIMLCDTSFKGIASDVCFSSLLSSLLSHAFCPFSFKALLTWIRQRVSQTSISWRIAAFPSGSKPAPLKFGRLLIFNLAFYLDQQHHSPLRLRAVNRSIEALLLAASSLLPPLAFVESDSRKDADQVRHNSPT